MYTWQRQQSYSISYLVYPHDSSLNLMKQTICGLSFYIVHTKKTSSCFMRKIKCLKCFLLTFLKESVFTQRILSSRYKMSRTSDAKFSYSWLYRKITFIIFLYSLESTLKLTTVKLYNLPNYIVDLFVDRSALLCLSSDIFLGTMSTREVSSYFGRERGKIINQKEAKTENKFTHREETREENDAQFPNSKPRNFQTKWLNDHKWLCSLQESSSFGGYHEK